VACLLWVRHRHETREIHPASQSHAAQDVVGGDRLPAEDKGI
jgi:hypothetical protein